MRHLDLKVGWNCNNKCIHCVVADKRKYTEQQDFSFEEIKQIILNNREAKSVTLTGGEPTIRPDFIEICKFIKKIIPDAEVDLQTNGRGLKDLEICKEAIKYIDFIAVAIHSYYREAHEEITGVEGSWDETISAVVNLLNLNVYKFQPLLVISKYNMNDISKITDFYHEIGAKNFIITFPHGMGNAWTYRKKVIPKYSDIKDHIDYVITKYPNAITSAIPPCYLLKNKRRIVDSLNEYKPHNNIQSSVCVELCNRNENKEDFYEAIKKDFAKSPLCEKCIYNDKCHGVWSDYVEIYKDELDLIPVLKK